MTRVYILTGILYNSGVTALLDFIVQCQEMYKDDVMEWGKTSGVGKKVLFTAYSQQYIGVPIDLMRDIRNYYVHDFDTKPEKVLDYIEVITSSDIACLCNYFNVEFDGNEFDKIYNVCIDYLKMVVEFKSNGGA